MVNKTQLLEEVANTVSMHQFVLTNEFDNLSANDILAIASEMQDVIGKLLVVANKIEREQK